MIRQSVDTFCRRVDNDATARVPNANETRPMKRPNTKQRLIGHARVSTDEQATEAQEMELRTAGCETDRRGTRIGRIESSAGARKAGQRHRRQRTSSLSSGSSASHAR